jgi:hypothetical protein
MVRSRPSPQDLVDLRTGVTAPDDSSRLDDQEESDLKKALALSIQVEEERQQRLSDLEEFQIREACQFKDKPVPDETTHGSSVVISDGAKGSAQIATQPDSSVKRTVPPATGGVPPAAKSPWKARPQVPSGKIGATSSTSVEPVSTRPNIRRDLTRQLEEVKDPPYITQQLLKKMVVHTDNEIQNVNNYVRGHHATSDYDAYQTGFMMWWRSENG